MSTLFSKLYKMVTYHEHGINFGLERGSLGRFYFTKFEHGILYCSLI